MKPLASLFLVLSLALAGSALAEEAAGPDRTPRLAYGQMLKHGEKVVFSPCRDRSYVMFDDVSPDGALSKTLRALGLEDGRKLYVEVLGYLDDGKLRASALNFGQTEGRCQLPGGKDETWRAAGHGPGWVLAVGNEVIVLKRDGQPDVAVPAGDFSTDGARRHYEAVQDGKRLAITFESAVCRDPAAQTAFGWTAQVKLNGQALQGCAWQR